MIPSAAPTGTTTCQPSPKSGSAQKPCPTCPTRSNEPMTMVTRPAPMNQTCPPRNISAARSATPAATSARAPAFTGSIWNDMAAMSRQMAPTTPGTMVPGWYISRRTPITPSMAMRYATSGFATVWRMRSRTVQPTGRSSAPAVCRRRFSPDRSISRPSIFCRSSGTSSAMRSMTRSFCACEAVMLTLSRTAFSAQSTFRERRSAMARTKAAVGEGADEGGGVFLYLLRHRLELAVIVLAARGPADPHRVRRPDVGRGRHGGDVGGEGEEDARRPGTRARRPHPEDDGDLGGQLRLDDVASRREQPAGGIEAHDERLRPACFRVVDRVDEIAARARIDRSA